MGIHLRLGGDEWGIILRGIHLGLVHRPECRTGVRLRSRQGGTTVAATVSECRSDVSECRGMEVDISTETLCVSDLLLLMARSL